MNSQIVGFGMYNLNRSFLGRLAHRQGRVNLRIVGVLAVASDVTPALVRQTVERLSLRGTIIGRPDTVAVLRQKVR